MEKFMNEMNIIELKPDLKKIDKSEKMNKEYAVGVDIGGTHITADNYRYCQYEND
ncbi:hypothetical protein ACQ9BO_24960 [Flavobacterium sp. P21]|uniref:hypothetical protein n=1 Tax=Flavobacterium sp. P21 TaxID=3423948 RepID=UPI003D66DCE4